MENHAKRIKLDADPLVVLCDDVHNLIFQHLEGKDVLSSFEISKNWNFRLTQSTAAMKSVTLNLPNRVSQVEARILMKSNRKYQNLQTTYGKRVNWNPKLRVIKRFSPMLAHLDIYHKIHPTAKHVEKIDFSFPNLKSMTIYDVSFSTFLGDLINAAPILEKISIVSSHHTNDCIAEKATLKEMTLNSYCSILQKKVAFKLTTFEIRNFGGLKLSHFLEQSFETLSSLKLDAIYPDLAAFALTKLPALKSLEYNFFYGDVEKVAAMENLSITSVKVSELDSFSKQFLLCMKGLQCLSFRFGSLKWITENRSNWDDLKSINGSEV